MPNVPSYTFGYLGMTTLVLGPHVTSIGDYTFTYNQLTSVTIPSNVTSIGSYAFRDNQLTSVTIEGKSSEEDFDEYDPDWGWADGYNDSNIIWTGSN